MTQILYADNNYADIDLERALFAEAGAELITAAGCNLVSLAQIRATKDIACPGFAYILRCRNCWTMPSPKLGPLRAWYRTYLGISADNRSCSPFGVS